MSHHTSLFVKYSGTSINFPQNNHVLSYPLGKASLDAAGEVYISQLVMRFEKNMCSFFLNMFFRIKNLASKKNTQKVFFVFSEILI